MPFARIAVLALGLLLTACGGDTSPSFTPLSYDYLNKIKLNVARIDIDDNWVPRGSARHVEYLAPTRPVAALRQMAEDRLVPGGTSGKALFVIDDASLIQSRTLYEASFTVHLDLLNEDGSRRGTATAKVHGARPIGDDDPDSVRNDLYELERKMMDDMNVELEYQIGRALRDQLQTTSPAAPQPGAVETQDLDTPKKP
ncbi:hypothetical protein [Limobrevibacterium gyesilva]|uniref:LPS-assembly lipoprotein LptE n=1 Tax=Limobrevibacterium gyesilva TaxID=2991712 RepID=A0AA41YJF8_9PROT|nr:hypothetical protein [Limobrevibacterium gyesilva]MCW3473381.1 hypothetical protein [Limobrevibacterium gyesilva]